MFMRCIRKFLPQLLPLVLNLFLSHIIILYTPQADNTSHTGCRIRSCGLQLKKERRPLFSQISKQIIIRKTTFMDFFCLHYVI